MNYRENTLIGFEGLRSHLLRSLLSMLGIIFGVGAVIAMLSIGEGAKQQALEQIQLMGMNNIIVEDVPIDGENQDEKRTNMSRGLTLVDVIAVRELNPHVEMTVPVRGKQYTVQYLQERIKANVMGTTPEYAAVMNFVPQEGSFFNFDDVDGARRVCALGNGVKRKLFYFRNPLGKRVKIAGQWFTVVGVMEKKSVSASRKQGLPVEDMNNDIYIPISASLKRLTNIDEKMTYTPGKGWEKSQESEINRFIARVSNVNRIQEAANILKNTMERRHNNVEDFTITVPEALLRQSRQTQRIFNIVMGAIAGISLLVGGIGIMNIMLASILERTREIGIRRASGATRADILGQFLTEAVMLSFVGGLIGIVVGFALTRAIAAYADWRTIVSLQSIMLSFGVSVAVGIIFGVYPARRAARMDPIEALRYE
ncbi:MAG: ABC transporter permease [Candidatus Latescibacteria bacterium]|nr:ABC transporter permease [Candidatus Latescibacterota bacterium]